MKLTRRDFIGNTLLALGSALALRCTLAQGAAASVAGKRVFIMGHSFHIFIAQRLQPLIDVAGIKGHELAGRQMIGGSRVQQHWDLPDEKNEAKKALSEGKVDILTMSPNWLLPDEGIDKFVELGLKHNPKLQVLVQESWMPWDGWLPDERVANNEARDARSLDIVRGANTRFKSQLEPQVRDLNKKLGRDVLHVAPVGDGVLKLRTLIAEGKAPGITKQSELFTDPIGHARAPVVMLATYCVFACLYRVNPVGLTDAQPELDRIDPKLKPLIQKLAWEAAKENPLSGVTGGKGK